MSRRDRGSAVVEFALLVPLLFLAAGVTIEVVLLMHAHSVITAAAAEGARVAALSTPGGAPRAAEDTVRGHVQQALAGPSIDSVRTRRDKSSGVDVLSVTVTSTRRLPLVDRPVTFTVTGRSVLP